MSNKSQAPDKQTRRLLPALSRLQPKLRITVMQRQNSEVQLFHCDIHSMLAWSVVQARSKQTLNQLLFVIIYTLNKLL
jgi:hypothetical protein